MKKLLLSLCLVLLPAVALAQVSSKANQNLEKMTFNSSGALETDTTTALPAGATTVVTAQLAVTATQQQLGSNAGKFVCLKVLDGGTRNVYFGPTGVATSTGMELIPGETACRTIDNSNRLFVIAAGTGSTVAYEIWD